YDGKIYANKSNDPFSGKWELQFSDSNLTKYIVYIKMFDSMKGIAMGECKDMYSPAIFLQTIDGGTNWVRRDKSRFIGGLLSACDPVIKFFNENVGFVLLYKQTTPNSAGPDSLYKTTNGGKDWSAIKTALSPLGHVRVFTENKIVNWGKEISITTDGGANWKNYTTPLTTSCSDYWLDEKNSSNIWVLSTGTYRGLYFSNNCGLSFSIKGGSTSSLRKMQVINNKVGFILGDAGDFFVTDDIQYYTTGLKEDNKSIPIEYSLEQNYPNPFNPSTKISFQIPQAGFVTLKIYDQLGREVETLVDEYKTAGSYDSQFQILNSRLSSGIYFYTLKAGSFVLTKKLVFLK
ncbi:MAG: T9SS type A sorting domain-containing protein, partial [Ignavibacteria bacterium]|nr:T9SS type A sorting domain-containing protein [Ignavibacteria bacterium]